MLIVLMVALPGTSSWTWIWHGPERYKRGGELPPPPREHIRERMGGGPCYVASCRGTVCPGSNHKLAGHGVSDAPLELTLVRVKEDLSRLLYNLLD